MTLRTRTIAGVAAIAALAVVGAAAPAAYARWKFHNDAIGETVVAPDGGTRANTCDDRLRAVAGYGHFIDVAGGEDPADFQLPSQALNSVGYKVWKPPAGFDSFAGAQENPTTGRVYFEDADGTHHKAKLVGSETTPPRAPLPDPVPAGGDPGESDNYVFTTAPLKVDLSGVKPGDLLGLAPAVGTGGIFTTVRAMNCDLPVLGARVNVVPGSEDNLVFPHQGTDQLPVRVFGSKRLKVRHITEIHLGDAAPFSAEPPQDMDGDGRADRLYRFQQEPTDIQCIDDTVKVTGRTSDGVRFQERSPITTAGCTG
jgi:hypothetical protein